MKHWNEPDQIWEDNDGAWSSALYKWTKEMQSRVLIESIGSKGFEAPGSSFSAQALACFEENMRPVRCSLKQAVDLGHLTTKNSGKFTPLRTVGTLQKT